MKKYEQTVYLFKAINTSKKYKNFTFTDLSWGDVHTGYCNKDEILRIDGKYFIYSGEIKNHWDEKRNSVIRFKERGNIIKEIKA